MADAVRPALEGYADAARRAAAGGTCAGGCSPFGAGNYGDVAGLPDAAVQASPGLAPVDVALTDAIGGGLANAIIRATKPRR